MVAAEFVGYACACSAWFERRSGSSGAGGESEDGRSVKFLTNVFQVLAYLWLAAVEIGFAKAKNVYLVVPYALEYLVKI
jgi:hypothetical protein